MDKLETKNIIRTITKLFLVSVMVLIFCLDTTYAYNTKQSDKDKIRELIRELETYQIVRELEEAQQLKDKTQRRTSTQSTIVYQMKPEILTTYKEPVIDFTGEEYQGAKKEYRPYMKSNLTVEQYNKILKDTFLEGFGKELVKMENTYNVNGLFTLSLLHIEQGLFKEAREKVQNSCNPFSILENGTGTPLQNFCLDIETDNEEHKKEIQRLGYINGFNKFAERITTGYYDRVGLVKKGYDVNATEFGKLYCGGNNLELWNGPACVNESTGRWDEKLVNTMDRLFEKIKD